MQATAGDTLHDAPADDGPLRTCVVTRRQLPVDDLVRFVAGPDGSLVPDIASRLPGRGVWVALDRKAVDEAARTKAFNRGLKRQVAVPADLGALVDRLLTKRLTEALALANKAGLVLTGFTKVDSAISAGSPVVLMHASDGSSDGADKLDRRFAAMSRDLGRSAVILTYLTNEEISLALGRANVVHAAITNGGAAQHLLRQAVRLGKYRTGRQDVD